MAGKTDTVRVDALKQTVEEVCVELASLGEESLFMSINLKQRSCFYLGSEPGKEFLTKRMDIIENFYHFINTNYPLEESESAQCISPQKSQQYQGDMDMERIPQTVHADSDNDETASFTIDNEMREDPDFEHTLKRSGLFKKRGVGRPRKMDVFDNRDRNSTLLEDMEKVIMNEPITKSEMPVMDEYTILNESGSKIEKIVTSDVEFVKSLRNNRKCLLICANCGTCCSWKRSMLTHLSICKGKKKEDKAGEEIVIQQSDDLEEVLKKSDIPTSSEDGTQIVIELVDGNGEQQIAVLQATAEDTLAQHQEMEMGSDPLEQAVRSITVFEAEKSEATNQESKTEVTSQTDQGEKEENIDKSGDNNEAKEEDKPTTENVHKSEEKEEDVQVVKEQPDVQPSTDEKQSDIKPSSDEKEDKFPSGEKPSEEKDQKCPDDQEETQDSTVDDEDFEENLEDIEAIESLIMTSENVNGKQSVSGTKENVKEAEEKKDNEKEGDIEEEDENEESEEDEHDSDKEFMTALTLRSRKKETQGESPTTSTRSRRQIKITKKYEDFLSAIPVRVKREPEEEEPATPEKKTKASKTKQNEEISASPRSLRKRKADDKEEQYASQAEKTEQTGTKTKDEQLEEKSPNAKRLKKSEEEEDVKEKEKDAPVVKEVITPKRGRGRPRKEPASKVTEEVVKPEPQNKEEDPAEDEEDWSPSQEEVKEMKYTPRAKRGRKRGGKKDSDTGYKITIQDINEAVEYSDEKGSYTCKQCNMVIKWKRSFMRHIESHRLRNEGKEDYHKCAECDKEFVSEWEMKNHMRGKHKMLGVFDCDTCPRKFNTSVQYKAHKKMCTEENPMEPEIEQEDKPFTCNYCLFKFRSEDQLNTHKDLHNIVEYKCDECGKVFPEGYRLKNHKRDAHDKSKHFACDICGKLFTSTRYLHRHRVCVHQKNESVCRYCGKLYPTKEELRLHIKVEHEETDALTCGFCKERFTTLRELDTHRPEHYGFQCETCGKKFQKLIKLREHLPVHTGTYPHHCHICKKGFLHKMALDQHVLTHDPNYKPLFMCDICGQQFKTKTVLLKHANVHKESVDYPCKFCETAYRTPEGLKIHMIEVHMTEEQIKTCGLEIFKCEICDKVMARKQHYDRHKAQHLGIKKYKCETCDMSFYTQYHLNRHFKMHHEAPRTSQSQRIVLSDTKVPVTAEEIITEAIVEDVPNDNTETVYIGTVDETTNQVHTISYNMAGESGEQMVEFVVINVPQDNDAVEGETVEEVTNVATTITAEDENDVVQSILNLQEGINNG